MGGSPPARQLGREPARNAEYLQPRYWDKRFTEEAQYEWFKDYSHFAPHLRPHLRAEDRILVLGCGNSSMSTDLWRDGFRNVTSIDLSEACPTFDLISEVVIRRMAEQSAAAGMTSLQWRVADMLDLPFEDASFDVVLEKGTMDVLFVDNDSPWQPRPEVTARVHRMLSEAHRVLSETGVLLSITFAQPHFRRPLLLAPQYAWSCRHTAVGETFHYFVYVLRKGNRSEADELPAAVCAASRTEQTAREPMMHEHMDSESYMMCIDL